MAQARRNGEAVHVEPEMLLKCTHRRRAGPFNGLGESTRRTLLPIIAGRSQAIESTCSPAPRENPIFLEQGLHHTKASVQAGGDTSRGREEKGQTSGAAHGLHPRGHLLLCSADQVRPLRSALAKLMSHCLDCQTRKSDAEKQMPWPNACGV